MEGSIRAAWAPVTAEAKAAHAARMRQRRATARAAAEVADTAQAQARANGHSEGATNGNGGITAARLWEHAAKISPKTPWRPVGEEFDLNKQQTLDAFRAIACRLA